MYLGGSLDHALRDLGLAANADGVIRTNLVDELVLPHGLGGVVHMPALDLILWDMGHAGGIVPEKSSRIL